MNNHKKIYGTKFLLNIILVFSTTCLVQNAIGATSLPKSTLPLTTNSTQQAQLETIVDQDKTSILAKLKNSIKNIFYSEEPEAAIKKELDENLASFIKDDKNNHDLINKNMQEKAASSISAVNDTNEPLTIPSLPEDKDPEKKQSINEAVKENKNERVITQNYEQAKQTTSSIQNSLPSANKVADQQFIQSKAIVITKSTTLPTGNAAGSLPEQLAEIKNSTSNLAVNSDNTNTSVIVQNKNRINKNETEQSEDLLIQEKDKFVIDEAKLLLLPEDDVVLGKVSLEAEYENMDDYAYLNLFNSAENAYQQSTEELHIDNFIGYYEHKNAHKTYGLSVKQASLAAFTAVRGNNLAELKMLLDNYPILQTRNSLGQNLLHLCVELENYSLAEFLIMRGININARDQYQNSPLSIAIELENNNLANLFARAGAR